MQIDVSFTKSVLTFYEEMVNKGISLIYLGEFNHEITKMFTSMAEDNLTKNKKGTRLTRKVYHVMVETLQNMNKHSDSISDNKIGRGLFMIGKDEKYYYVITCNKIRSDRTPYLKKAIELINNSSKEALRQMFMEQIKGTYKQGELSDKGGAGLGLIDVARKTGEKYQYHFLRFDEHHDFFLLKVRVAISQ